MAHAGRSFVDGGGDGGTVAITPGSRAPAEASRNRRAPDEQNPWKKADLSPIWGMTRNRQEPQNNVRPAEAALE